MGEGTVVLADRQERGRGRHGSPWISPLGGLYASLIVRKQPLLPFRAGIAVAEALCQIGVSGSLKWPNDVLVGERKIAGILIEAVENWAVVGIGVNIGTAPAPGTTNVAAETSVSITPEGLLELILKHFLPSLSEREVLGRYRELCDTLGYPVRMLIGKDVIEGRAIDVDPQGRLLVEDHAGRHVVSSGECCSVRAGLST
jgi:BirA family biotin operon repressor/biotin-[acetyl-CoA-carboxylase] ligase